MGGKQMGVKPRFQDRSEAGKILAAHVAKAVDDPDIIVLALPRGGVPVAFEVARSLRAPMDIYVVRKLGLPGEEELAIGAIASGGVRVLNRALIAHLQIPEELIERVTAQQSIELERREQLYRGTRGLIPLRGHTTILVDDGLATGATMLAAVRSVRAQQPRRIVVAVPVASSSACEDIREDVDQTVCVVTPEPFLAVGAWYDDFSQTSDSEVRSLLAQSRGEASL
ncbi:MAG TPA: phosphoribosyltransferase [Bryobacteraceae bacterium]|nr:phosphoribosyltransferase [Bryobacteraceae bacterium]